MRDAFKLAEFALGQERERVFNIGGVTGLIPLTGIPLLMVSAGGSSTMSFMACVGLSQAVIAAFRRGEIQ